MLQHDDRGEQRDRDRGTADRRGAQIEQEKDQHDDHQRATDEQRGAQIVGRRDDEVGGPEQAAVQRHALGLQAGLEIGKRCLDRLRHFQGVGAILLVDVHHDAGLAHDRRRADGRLRRLDDVSDVAERNAAAVWREDGRAGDIVRREPVRVSLQGDALVRRCDESGAADAGRAPRRREHVLHAKAVADQPIGMDEDLASIFLRRRRLRRPRRQAPTRGSAGSSIWRSCAAS